MDAAGLTVLAVCDNLLWKRKTHMMKMKTMMMLKPSPFFPASFEIYESMGRTWNHPNPLPFGN
jgi:hypothetical protein